MNRFADLVDALKRRPHNDAFKKLLDTLDGVDDATHPEEREPALRLPYSSDPTPIGEPWA